jgi:hypothetical protein
MRVEFLVPPRQGSSSLFYPFPGLTPWANLATRLRRWVRFERRFARPGIYDGEPPPFVFLRAKDEPA